MMRMGGERVFFVDFQAYQHKFERFKPVEICVMSSYNFTHPLLLIYTQEEKWHEILDEARKRTYKYEFANLHRIQWNNDSCRYYDAGKLYEKIMIKFSPKRGEKFFVHGLQKLTFLREELPQLN